MSRARLTTPLLLFVVATFSVLSLSHLRLLQIQPAGVDFAGFWAGGRAALTDVARLYDFRYVSELQGWPLGPERLRPFAYPPSALLLFMPFAVAPWSIGYVVWTVATGAFFGWAGVKFGAPKWFVLAPWVAFTAFSGQATFLLGGLVMTAMAINDERPLLAGMFYGAAAAVKPQLLILLPLALLAETRWRTIIATGVTGLVLCGTSVLAWGLQPWFDWLHALPRFEQLVSGSRSLVANAITPRAALDYWRQDTAWGLMLAPLALLWVWFAFRREASLPDRLIALFGGAFLISPYAMNYELALFAPATAAYLARTEDRRWFGYAAAGLIQSMTIHPAFIGLVATLALPLQKAVPPFRREEKASLPPSR